MQSLYLIIFFLLFQYYTSHQETQCFPNKWCLNGTSMIGLRWNMTVVQNATYQCSSQVDCLEKLCKLNDIPQVSWVVFRITGKYPHNPSKKLGFHK